MNLSLHRLAAMICLMTWANTDGALCQTTATSEPNSAPLVADSALGDGSTANTGFVVGQVVDDQGPVAHATVRVQTRSLTAMANASGHFRLPLVGAPEGTFCVTAWAPGYYCGGVTDCRTGQEGIEIRLKRHPAQDNPSYEWLSYRSGHGPDDKLACTTCHSRESTDLSHLLPVDEWLLDAHSQSATNQRFLTMYEGRDLQGRRSPVTRYAVVPEYGRVALRPDTTQPYYGPGYRLDFPHSAGNCAACHVPVAAVAAPYDTDPTSVRGVGAEGVACDLCHKISEVILDPQSSLPFANMPGVLSLKFLRPPPGHQYFAGPFDDVTAGEDTYLPLQQESRFCAPCHFGVFWDTVIYNSYGEWLESSYSDPETGQTCQDCHMPRTGASCFALPEKGGLLRDPRTIFGHAMPGASDPQLLKSAVTMEVVATVRGNTVMVSASITNDRTGHHVPTDSPLRHMILLVEARDKHGNALTQVSGSTVPAWGGEGEPARGCFAGLPGKGFAKILEEQWTGISPTGAYWNPTRLVSDNRLAAGASDHSTYGFRSPGSGSVNVRARLLFRRAFKTLMDQKGWTDPDILMQTADVAVSVRSD